MTASVLSNLSEMLGQQSKLKEAEDLAREALQVCEEVWIRPTYPQKKRSSGQNRCLMSNLDFARLMPWHENRQHLAAPPELMPQ